MDLNIFFLVVLGLCIYFSPTIVAGTKKHSNGTSIFLLNLFLGWSLIGWVVALVWAFKKPELQINNSSISIATEITTLKKLYDDGIISEDEFQTKKKSLLE